MEKYRYSDVLKIQGYIDSLEKSPNKWSILIELNEISKLMRAVGFMGPVDKKGSKKQYTHELLKTCNRLTGGAITIHIQHQKKIKSVTYRDFKTYLKPNIEFVLNEIKEKNLIIFEDKNNVNI